jgi:hypothetical protein
MAVVFITVKKLGAEMLAGIFAADGRDDGGVRGCSALWDQGSDRGRTRMVLHRLRPYAEPASATSKD